MDFLLLLRSPVFMALNAQKIDKHFHLLGLSRGCSEEDLRKAYRQKALAFHPDRNPQGAEAFKEVNAAYENLKAYFERHSNKSVGGVRGPRLGGGGSVDSSTSPAAPAGSAGACFRHAGFYGPHYYSNGSPRPNPSFSFPSSKGSPVGGESPSFYSNSFSSPSSGFTDEELFGNTIPGGWTKRQTSMGSGTTSPPSSSHGSNHYTTGTSSATFTEKEERWRRAHGDRVPVSGYTEPMPFCASPLSSAGVSRPSPPQHTPAKERNGLPSMNGSPSLSPAFSSMTNSPSPTNRMSSSHHRFYQHAPSSSECFNTVPSTYDDLKELIQALYAKTAYVNQPRFSDFPRSEKEAMDLLKENRVHDIWESLRNVGNEEERRRVLQSGWKQLDEELKEKTESARRRFVEQKEEQAREASRHQALTEERRRLQAVEEAARRVREERQLKAKQAAEELAAALRQEKDEQHQDDLLDDKRRLLKMMFRLQYSPDPSDVGDMSDVEVFTLTELMEDLAGKVRGVLTARLQRGPCSRCHAAPKATEEALGSPVFTCSHAAVCLTCATRATQCPLCGAKRTIPILPVVPNPPPRHTTTSSQEPAPSPVSCSLPDVRSTSRSSTGGVGGKGNGPGVEASTSASWNKRAESLLS